MNQYIVIKTMGRGAYGKVKLCLDSQTHELYAIKVINHARAARRIRALPSRQPYSTLDADVVQEIAVMKQLDHPNIVRLVEVIGEGRVSDSWGLVKVAGLHGAMLVMGAGEFCAGAAHPWRMLGGFRVCCACMPASPQQTGCPSNGGLSTAACQLTLSASHTISLKTSLGTGACQLTFSASHTMPLKTSLGTAACRLTLSKFLSSSCSIPLKTSLHSGSLPLTHAAAQTCPKATSC